MTDYLIHHGVKGMHWGVRRYQNYDGTLKTAGKRHASSKKEERKARKEYKDGAYKRSKSMTDEELQKANKRYAAEQTYRRNVQQDIEASRGKASTSARKVSGKFNDKVVEKVLETAATVLVTAILVSATKSPNATAVGKTVGSKIVKGATMAVSKLR